MRLPDIEVWIGRRHFVMPMSTAIALVLVGLALLWGAAGVWGG